MENNSNKTRLIPKAEKGFGLKIIDNIKNNTYNSFIVGSIFDKNHPLRRKHNLVNEQLDNLVNSQIATPFEKEKYPGMFLKTLYTDSVSANIDSLRRRYITGLLNKDLLESVDFLYKDLPHRFNIPFRREDNPKVGDIIWKLLLKHKNLSYLQKLAMMGSTYHESDGWTKTELDKGPARGYFLMELGTMQDYKKWLNGRPNTIENQVDYVVDLFDRKDTSQLRTSYDRKAKVVPEELKYTTEEAFKMWDSNDLDSVTTAFTALFERPKKAKMKERLAITNDFKRFYLDNK